MMELVRTDRDLAQGEARGNALVKAVPGVPLA
jgi:hypothetical protein